MFFEDWIFYFEPKSKCSKMAVEIIKLVGDKCLKESKKVLRGHGFAVQELDDERLHIHKDDCWFTAAFERGRLAYISVKGEALATRRI